VRGVRVRLGPALLPARSLPPWLARSPLGRSWWLRLRTSAWLTATGPGPARRPGGATVNGLWIGWCPPCRLVWVDPTGQPRIGVAASPWGLLVRVRAGRRRAREEARRAGVVRDYLRDERLAMLVTRPEDALRGLGNTTL